MPKLDSEGVEEVWIEKTYFTTEESFPTVLRRSEVVAREVLEISPIESALQDVEQKTRELAALNIRYSALSKTAQVLSTNPLAMTLNGVVDAPVNGGIARYRQAFLTPAYLIRYPERAEDVERLRNSIDEQVRRHIFVEMTADLFARSFVSSQVRVIDHCLRLHGQLCPPEMLAFHETMEKWFRKNFQDEIRRLSVDGQSERPLSRVTGPPAASSYASSVNDTASLQRTVSTTSTTRPPFVIPPLQLGRPVMTPPPDSPRESANPSGSAAPKQTPLQRHLAHLARHGMNGVSSAPGEGGTGSDSVSAGSPQGSLLNVVGVGGHPVAASSGSIIGSVGGSLRGRFSRLGSLNFGRKDGP